MSGSMGNKIRHNSKAFTTCEQNRAVAKALLFFVLSKYDQPDKDKRLNMRKTNNNNISKVIEEYISSSRMRPIPFYRVKEEVYKAWEEAESEVFFDDSIGKGKKTQREPMDKIMRYTGLDRKVVEELVK